MMTKEVIRITGLMTLTIEFALSGGRFTAG